MDEHNTPQRLLILVGSPRRDGNSATLAEAVRAGAEAAGSEATLLYLDDYLQHFVGDCRRCRREDGECSLQDNFRSLLFDHFLPADGVVFCSPVYWYGPSAQMKAFFDRGFCYYAASYPQGASVLARMAGKRIGLVLASEETYPGVGLGIIHQVQEYTRYIEGAFVGVVQGAGNRRGEVRHDPRQPLVEARKLGEHFFTRHYSDYRLATVRKTQVWN